MKIGYDITPIDVGSQHKFRGVGYYVKNLRDSLLKVDRDNSYVFFTKNKGIPKDIELVHYPYFELFFLSLPIIKQYRTVVTVHDLTPIVFKKHFPAGIKGELIWIVQKRSLKKSDYIITDSFSSKRDIVKFTGISEKKIKVIYLAASSNFQVIKKEEKKIIELKNKYGLPEKYLLYVGDVTWNKNLPRLIRAIKNINIPLVIVGKAINQNNFDKTNPWNKDLVEVNELMRNDERFIKLGYVSEEDLVSIYNFANALLMPSLYEGFGLPILEAMSCGCPVITSKAGSLVEIAGDAAMYVDPYDEKDIIEKVKKIMRDNTLRSELSRKGIIQAKKFSWIKTAQETIKLYEEINSER